ncbi:hypothetical protein [Hymenobacter properus]|uniref:Lipoprotein n=1 Tax=Hymenobacter properus TaxID=2791026 RepID=A0A931BEZ8_9BACT|nr:hypothetical protein [Hymenobacter properus]MBF9140456.1 hypothetical protein [Hymenobacter properus]MBR7719263.1 hypothetical protein [Microvirga sp. SRT04]
MNLFRTLTIACSALAGLGLSSCLSAPDYPVVPAIDFKSVDMVVVPTGTLTAIDTLKFSVDFRDGDGDLGLSDDDIKVAPFNATTGGFNNRGYAYNYSIQPYKRNGNAGNYTYTKFVNAGGVEGEYNGRFLHLEKEGSRPAPLKGTLTYALPLSVDGAPFYPGDTFRFEITIMDRALNRSNTVTTTDVTLKGAK